MAKTLRGLEIETVGVNGKAVTEIYGCPNDDMKDEVVGVHGETNSIFSGETAPVCYRAAAQGHFYRTNEARLVAYYKTLTWPEWMMAHPNQGKVFTSPAQTAQRRIRDMDDQLIEGQSEDHPEDKVWRIKEGENFNFRPKEHIIVRAIVNDKNGYLDYFDPLIGCINESTLGNIKSDNEPGHFLYLGKNASPILHDTPLWQVGYHLLYHNKVWNAQCITELYEWIRKRFLTMTLINGQLTSSGTYWLKWIYNPTGETREHKLFAPANISLLNDMVA